MRWVKAAVGRRRPRRNRPLEGDFIGRKTVTSISKRRGVVGGERAQAQACDSGLRQTALDGAQEIPGKTPPTKRRRDKDIGDEGEAIGVRRFDDRIRLLDPARDEADKGAGQLGDQHRAALRRPALDPVEIGVGDLFPGQTRIMKSTLVVLERDDGASQVRTVGGRGGSNPKERRHERLFAPYSGSRQGRALRRRLAKPLQFERGDDLRFVGLALRRLVVGLLGLLAIWLIAFVFRLTDHEAPTLLALAATYAVAAYVILPWIVRMSLKLLQHGSVPSFTLTGDGFPGDPVNLALVGTFAELRAAFARAGWFEADPLGLRSSWGMAESFVLNRPYPTAPFSTLYLFGRKQDAGFQKAVGGSPRKRHHIRFWALSAERAAQANAPEFWLNAERPPLAERALWVGAGTRDTGLSFTKLTFQFTHATAADTNAERDFILAELKAAGAIGEPTWHREGERLTLGKVNHYVADGEIAVARLA